MAAKALMIQGTGSSVGKSLVAAALCRIFTQDGFRVRPFKSQNMSNNAFVTTEGGEISRAQAEQAMACGVEPSVHMNPVLLKPSTDVGAQVVVLGKAVGTMSAQAYQAFKPQVVETITQSLARLLDDADILVIEGAGSPAEINLKAHDVANMWVAKQAGAKVVLVGDIDRGGVFAQLVGTMELLPDDERRLVRGFLINKFRGDLSLLEPGLAWLEERARRPVLGTIPYFPNVELPEEDAIPESRLRRDDALPVCSEGTLRIEVIRLPRMANFTDFDALARESDVELRYLDQPGEGALPDGLILPGSKSTIADLASVRARGLDRYLARCAASGVEIVGICGGFQMLGRQILDPGRVEAAVDAAPGLGLLPSVTLFEQEKATVQVRGIHLESGLPVTGYEIRMGRMRDDPGASAVFQCLERGGAPSNARDGMRAAALNVWGTYLHGVFDAPEFRRWWLNRLRARRGWLDRPADAPAAQGVYDRLADAVRPHLKLGALYDLLWEA